ncbi:MAG: hypothetical protein LJE61_01850 [Thiocapsa sp.]|nr:DUF6776 family protein [Thiocapsa sp.]MCG6897531.1 hypothetical protein [Thiocapsa sp.]MCG6983930.1 hypothetical protein [Thiocapsa sp.]
MSTRRSVTSRSNANTADSMTDSFRRLSYRLLAIGLYAVLLAAAFWGGFELGVRRLSSGWELQLAALTAEVRSVVAERESLREGLATALRERVILERSHQIDREAARALTDQLKQAQDARLALNRELSYLKRLVQEGGRGAMRVQDLHLMAGDGTGAFRYSFTVTQMVPGFGEAEGRVRFEIEGHNGDTAMTLSLSDLPAAEPRELRVAFEHFQTLSGTFELPDGFEPSGVVVGIEPSSESLIPTLESFPWALETGDLRPEASLDDGSSEGR